MTESANIISSDDGIEMPPELTQQLADEPEYEEMSIDEAIDIIGMEIPNELPVLSVQYSRIIRDLVLRGKYTFDVKYELADAYFTMAAEVLALQIRETGRFTPKVDFSVLDDVQIFRSSSAGVDVCKACNGVGGLVKFEKTPKKVQCLKCKEVEEFDYYDPNQKDEETANPLRISIKNDILLVNGEDHSKDSAFNWMFGRRVETCLSCKGTGRYLTQPQQDLIINVQCRTCKGRKLQKNSTLTQVLVKCRTCKASQMVEIPVIVGKTQSKTTCRVCDGIGYVRPRREPDNPVIPRKVAKEIKNITKGR